VKAWSDWEIIRRQVAIGGRVVDANNQPVGGVQVTLGSIPVKLKRQAKGRVDVRAAGREDLEQRPDRTLSQPDGVYFFLDLPEGTYTVSATEFRTGKHGQKSASIVLDKQRNLKMAQADLKLSTP
jgi:hypothetical protein